MDRLLAKEAILQTVYNMNYAEDELDEQLMRSCFIPDQNIILDNSSHLPQPPMSISPDQWWDMVMQALSGFTATQHSLFNPVITFSDETVTAAHLKANVLAYHCIQGNERGEVEEVSARGLQEIDLVLWQGKWMIVKVETKRSVPLDMALYEKAAQRATEGKGRKAKGQT